MCSDRHRSESEFKEFGTRPSDRLPNNYYTSRLTGSIANEMPTKVIMKAERKTLLANDEFVIVVRLHPEVLIGLKFLIEHRCTAHMVEQKLTIQKDDWSIVKVPIQILREPSHPPEDETVPGPDTVPTASEVNTSERMLTKF